MNRIERSSREKQKKKKNEKKEEQDKTRQVNCGAENAQLTGLESMPLPQACGSAHCYY